MKLQAVALQMSAPFGEVDANRERLAETVRSLGSEPDLVVTPELVVTGYNLEGFDEGGWELAEPLDGPTVAMLRRLAAHQHLTVVVGILEEGPDGALYDTAVIV
ncbi:MAG: nitrilase-related carbon-nitrogen hydrolase, partial [Acidimicrobiia bacterium]